MERQSGNMGHLNRNIYVMLNLSSGPKHRGSLQKNMVFPERNNLLAGDFCANLNETKADMVLFTQRWNWKLIL